LNIQSLICDYNAIVAVILYPDVVFMVLKSHGNTAIILLIGDHSWLKWNCSSDLLSPSVALVTLYDYENSCLHFKTVEPWPTQHWYV
jgi:hypothetical protein